MIKIGIIGLSRRSGIITNFLPRNKAEIAAVADLESEKLDAFTQCKFKTTDYRELLKRDELDAVFIMTRDYEHEKICIDALQAGKTVYLEKPMAITIEGCDRILKTAVQTKTGLFPGHNMRYMPVILKMKELIDSGIIGNIQAVWCRHFVSYGSCYFRHWCSERKNSGGLLLQKGAHDIDVIHWLCGSYTARVTGMGKLSVYNKTKKRKTNEKPDRELAFKNKCWPPLEETGFSPIIDIEDHNMILMTLANGIQCSYMQCFYTPDSERNYTFIGTAGRLENIGDTGNCEIHVWTSRGSRQKPDKIYRLKKQTGGHGGADPAIISDFIDFAADNTVSKISPIAARNAVAVGVLGHLSARNGSVPRNIIQPEKNILKYFAFPRK
ncbi:MAG TPA: oxidoreductase [Spirochaetia bacterium]|nr:oxidoreductase [Spirochaetia bacterium]